MFDYASFAVRNPSFVTKNARKQPEVRRNMLAYRKDHPTCEASGKTWNLQVHHLKPVSTHPELAGDMDNFIVLHKSFHWVLGHWGNWKNSVTNLRDLIEFAEVQKTIPADKFNG